MLPSFSDGLLLDELTQSRDQTLPEDSVVCSTDEGKDGSHIEQFSKGRLTEESLVLPRKCVDPAIL